MSSTQLFRLLMGVPSVWDEQLGDPITNLGGAPVPAPRTALRHAVTMTTLAADGASDTLAARLIIRRQLRSMLNNTDLKLQGYVYVQYSDDPEQNGWYIPDQGQLTSGEGTMGLASGYWNLAGVAWMMAGHKRTHREARYIWMKNLITGLYWRDTLKWLYGTDFSAFQFNTLQISYLPPGATSIVNTLTTGTIIPATMPIGRDGGACQLVTGQPDQAVLSYERPETSFGLGDVIVYDRNDQGTTQSTYKAAVLADGPVGYWRLDETTGTLANDSSSTGIYDGTYTGGFTLNQTPGALTGSGDSDACVLLNGSTGYVAIAHAAALNTSQFTLEGWIKPTATTAGFVYNTEGGFPGFGLKYSAGVLSALMGTSSTTTTFSTSTLVTLNAWNHVAVTYNGSIVSLYVNGVLAQSQAFTTYVPDTGTTTRIGSDGSSFFTGDIDEIAYYNYALSANQVMGHYGLGISTTGAGGDPQDYEGWSEVYGPDWPWSWEVTGAGFNDAPVLDNGLVRVRYDNTNSQPGFRVDVWNGSLYVEQGKMIFVRIGDSTSFDTAFVTAALHTDGGYTPDRAILAAVFNAPSDVNSRERIFVTVERGSYNVTFECYPAVKSAGGAADAAMYWTPALTAGAADVNGSCFKNDSASAVPSPAGSLKNIASAGTGAGTGHSGLIAAATLGAANFTSSENWAAILRCPAAFATVAAYQVTLTVLQAANAFAKTVNTAQAYGVNQDVYVVSSQNAAGYLQTQVSFGATQVQQILEAEAMTLGANTVTAVDAAASGTGSNTTTATRTTDANAHVTQAGWPNAFSGTFRVMARVKTSASTLNIYATTGATTGSTVTTASTTYVWLDLGELVAANTTLSIHCWATAAATVSVDRIEAVLVQDRTRSGAIYSGSRDAGQAALYDSRQFGAVVSR